MGQIPAPLSVYNLQESISLFRKHNCDVESIFIILSMALILYGPEGIHKAVRATCTLQKVPWHSEQLLTGNTMKLKSEGICQSLHQGFGWDINKEQDFSEDSVSADSDIRSI